MGDYTTCKHDVAVGYCDICSPGWEQQLFKDDTMNAVYQRGYERGKAESLPAPEARAAAIEEPLAFAVYCESPSEFDYLVFANLEDAQREATVQDNGREPIPLYPASPAPAALPDGWISVPVEPTEEMIQAWHDRQIEGANYVDKNSIEYALYVECYKAMLSAAPSSAERGEGS